MAVSLSTTFRRTLGVQTASLVLVGFAALAGLAYWVDGRIRQEIELLTGKELKAALAVERAALQSWVGNAKSSARSLARDPSFIDLVERLREHERASRLASQGGERPTGEDDVGSEASPEAARLVELRRAVTERLRTHQNAFGFVGFGLTGAGRVLAASEPRLVGEPAPARRDVVARVRAGEELLIHPGHGVDDGDSESSYVAVPVTRDDEVIGSVVFVLDFQDALADVLETARAGSSGESYAFDRKGRMLSSSRFQDEIEALGLLAPGTPAALNLRLADPGGDLTQGHPLGNLDAMPLTRAVGDAVRGGSAVDASGYRDYRGVPVVGAWAWDDDLALGLVSELDYEEAYRPVATLRRMFWVVLGALLVTLAGAVVAVTWARINQRRSNKADAMLQRLGQYELREKLGAGGMGVVYRGAHAMLKRETAIKLLRGEISKDENAVARFEREVRVTATLANPHTISIFDYGRTREGVFYYAMELLRGVSFDDLVIDYGKQPPGRVALLLAQACESLAEAHENGLIHRDIKPANLFLCRRGFGCDFVKVLDFGLVKDIAGGARAGVTQANRVLGTPTYMAPEAATNPETIDHRSDLYSLGATAFFLLTGRDLLEGDSVVEVLMSLTTDEPVAPSEVEPSIPPDLDAVVLRCLQKTPEDRFADAAELAAALRDLPCVRDWGRTEAERWWRTQYQPSLEPEAEATFDARRVALGDTVAVELEARHIP